jgi:NAD(P)-dependent dehydrogenase (short-subunit alcohol dehydrogenase family)
VRDLRGKTGVVTGAASGIGRGLAVNLAREGCSLALADVDETGLNETISLIDREDMRANAYRVDVSDRGQMYRFADEVMEDFGKVDIVINNAGVQLKETLEDVTYEDLDWLLGINLYGVIYGSKAFLPYLRKQPMANLVNVSSVQGMFTNPNSGPYCTSKFAIRGFTLTLAQELRGTTVKVSCVYPGGVRTNIVRNERFYKVSRPEISKEDEAALFDKYIVWTSVDRAARAIIKGVKKNKPRILVGPDAYFYDMITRIMPVTWQRFMARAA